MTNAQFASKDSTLAKACELAGIPCTRRQASKWRQGKGKAFGFKRAASKQLS